ncbi:MAG: formate dehydrogenase accessory protein FdhE [Thermodesulfobacteriota bacterium]
MEQNLKRFQEMKQKMPAYREVLDLAEKLLEAKRQMMAELSLVPLFLEKSNVKMHLQEGFPYIKLADFPLDLGRAEKYFYDLLRIFNAQTPQKYEALHRILMAEKFSFRSFLNDFCNGSVEEGKISKELGPEGSLLFFFTIQTLRPFLERYAQQWQKERTQEISWIYGYCPFCGGYAGLGEIREEGQRALYCSLCFTGWTYPRLRCPYCQNGDQEKLSYFQVEGEIDKRVDVCLLCRHYLKTVDSRERSQPVDWEVEDYLTLHLDYIAQEEGFQRPVKLFVEVK